MKRNVKDKRTLYKRHSWRYKKFIRDAVNSFIKRVTKGVCILKKFLRYDQDGEFIENNNKWMDELSDVGEVGKLDESVYDDTEAFGVGGILGLRPEFHRKQVEINKRNLEKHIKNIGHSDTMERTGIFDVELMETMVDYEEFIYKEGSKDIINVNLLNDLKTKYDDWKNNLLVIPTPSKNSDAESDSKSTTDADDVIDFHDKQAVRLELWEENCDKKNN